MSEHPCVQRDMVKIRISPEEATNRIAQLERELAEAKEALGNWKDVAEGMSAWKDELLQVAKQRDQWRDVATELAHAIKVGNDHGYGLRIGDEATAKFRKLKESQQ